MAKFKVGDLVLFQAYPEHEPYEGRVKRIGKLGELGKMQLDADDKRIFYELEKRDKSYSIVFTTTTSRWIKLGSLPPKPPKEPYPTL
jgi:hypothetical protein